MWALERHQDVTYGAPSEERSAVKTIYMCQLHVPRLGKQVTMLEGEKRY